MGRVGFVFRRSASSRMKRWQLTVLPIPYSPSSANNRGSVGFTTQSSMASTTGVPWAGMPGAALGSRSTVEARESRMSCSSPSTGSCLPIFRTSGKGGVLLVGFSSSRSLLLCLAVSFWRCPRSRMARATMVAFFDAFFWSSSFEGLFLLAAQSQMALMTITSTWWFWQAVRIPDPSISPPMTVLCKEARLSRYSLLSTNFAPLTMVPMWMVGKSRTSARRRSRFDTRSASSREVEKVLPR